MNLAFVVASELTMPSVMDLLKALEIDYYTRWDRATGKGHGTDPHLGAGSFGSTNSVLMIGFDDRTAFDALCERLRTLNEHVHRRDEQVRLFSVPLEAIL